MNLLTILQGLEGFTAFMKRPLHNKKYLIVVLTLISTRTMGSESLKVQVKVLLFRIFSNSVFTVD